MVSDDFDVKQEWRNAIKEGLFAAWPICLGYIAIGLAFGVIARKTGLRPLEIGLMSLIVYAGSSQFIAAAMLGAEAGFIPIILTTFSVNLRHILMSSSLSPFLRNLSGSRLSLFAYGVTDESFALNLSRFQSGKWGWRQALIVNHSTNFTWILSTVAGGIGGQFIPEGAFGIDYALTAMFICLLGFQLRRIHHILVALFSGVLAVILCLMIPGNSYILIATFFSASIGLLLRKTRLSKNNGVRRKR
jgi:4-azaleucine resistance transporter AzlC